MLFLEHVPAIPGHVEHFEVGPGLARAARELDTVDRAVETDIREHGGDVGRGCELCERTGTVGGLDRAIAERANCGDREVANIVVIIDDQDERRRRHGRIV